MKRVHTTVKYDGPALADKSMDVAHLAPALLALSDLVKEANRYANGDRAAARIYVNADIEQKCFELDVSVALTIWEQAKLLLADDNVRSAKDLFEWIGIAGGGFGLFQLIKWLKGKTVSNVVVLRVKDGDNLVEITVEGDEKPKQVAQAVYELYANVTTRHKALAVLAPLREDGYDSLEFYEKEGVFVHFHEEDVPASDGSDLPEVIPQNVHISTIRTGVKIRRAVYEGRAKWTVMYQRAREASFDGLALSWLDAFQRGDVQAPPGSYLDVDLEENYVTNDLGEIVGEATFKIVRVHGVHKRHEQPRLDFKDED
ncbi:hypothetical protein [Cypionkella sinensis]|uniref:Uncharacterized protein n=1 Tax=Cypionkella sinensis TaxID=1756043 RepID=A0ABV7J1K1_9RHOB